MGSASISQVVDYEGYSSEYAYGTASWDGNGNVTVTLTSSNVLTWRIRGRNPDTREYLVVTGGGKSGTFKAEDGKEYAFQVYSQTYGEYSPTGKTTGEGFFTVDFSDDSGGESGGGEDTSASAHTLHINQGEGTIIKVQRTWSDFGATGYLSDGDTVYYPADRFQITAEPLEGYEIDYYDSDDGEHLPFMMDNLTKPYDGEPYQLLYAADATISATATTVATVHIYNKDNSGWNRYAPYIYNKDSGWDRYAPFVYNGSSWNRYS